MFGYDIGIDLGTATVLIYVKGKGIVLKEPSVVSIDKTTGKVKEVGLRAQEMLGRTPENIRTIRPLRDGVISDYDTTERMLKYFIKAITGHSFFHPRVIVCVPSGITQVEKMAVEDAANHAGARTVRTIEEPMAAAIGAGLDISLPNGNLVVDVGGGTTDIAVISLKDVVVSKSVKVAGDKFDDAIVKFIRRAYNILIGERTAEEIKIKVGCVFPREEKVSIEIKGRCLMTGLPKQISVNSEEIIEALEEPAMSVIEAIHSVIERTPPELVGDIYTNGICMTGGGSLVYGFDKLIQAKTGIKTYIADDPVSCVAVGTGMAFDYFFDYTPVGSTDSMWD